MQQKYQEFANFLAVTRNNADKALELVLSIISGGGGGEGSTEWTDFHYTPTGTGVLSGRELITQTEDAINDIGSYSWSTRTLAVEALGNSETALQSAAQAVETANAARTTAEQAEINSAQAEAAARQAAQAAQAAITQAQQAVARADTAAQSAAAAQAAAEDAAETAQGVLPIVDAVEQQATAAVNAANQAVETANSADSKADQATTVAQQAVASASSAAQSAADSASAAQQLANPNRYSTKTTELVLSVGQTVDIDDLDNPNVAVGNKVVDANGNIFEIATIDAENYQVTLVDADLDIGDSGYWANPSIRYNNAQNLTEAQKTQARSNIGAQSSTDVQSAIGNNAVKYSESQTLTDAQKTQARANIGAAADSEVVKLSGDQTVAGVKTFSSSLVVPTLNRFDTSTKSVNAAWAYGLARQGNHLDLIDLGTPDDAFWDSIDDGTFSKAPVGGYVTLNGHRYYMAHGDYWLHCGDTETTKHHMLVIPASYLDRGKMNSTSTTAGGYVGSDFKTGNNGNTAFATIKSIIETDWGSSHILTHREHFTNAVTNGFPVGAAWYDSDIDLMSEPMVYGCKISEPIGNGSTVPNNSTIDKSQIELFRRRPDLITIRSYWWLRGVISAGGFAVVGSSGISVTGGASDPYMLRPAFAICKSNS